MTFLSSLNMFNVPQHGIFSIHFFLTCIQSMILRSINMFHDFQTCSMFQRHVLHSFLPREHIHRISHFIFIIYLVCTMFIEYIGCSCSMFTKYVEPFYPFLFNIHSCCYAISRNMFHFRVLQSFLPRSSGLQTNL